MFHPPGFAVATEFVHKAIFMLILMMTASLAMSSAAQAVDHYWVGGTGTWDGSSTAHWSLSSGGGAGASVPTTSDNVYFNGSSGAGTVTVGAGVSCAALDFTGFTQTFSHGANLINAHGNVKFVAGMTYTLNATPALSQISINASGNLTTGTKTLGRVKIYDVVGLQDAMTAAELDVYGGTFSTNNYTCSWGLFSSTGSTTRTVNFGSSTITINGASATPFDLSSASNLTLNAGTSAMTITPTASSTSFVGMGYTFYDVSFTGTSTPTISGANTFHNLTRTGTAVTTDSVILAADQVVTGTLTLSGNSAANRLLVKSDTTGTQRTLTVGTTVTVSNTDFVDIKGAGAASWDISGATGGSGNCGGNSGITFTTATTLYWFKDTGNWGDVTKWFLGTGGSGGAGRVPLAQDTARFDASSFSAGAQTVTVNCPRIGSVDWTGTTNTPTWKFGNDISMYGSLTLIAGISLTVNKNLTFENRSPVTITSAGKTMGTYLYVNCYGSKVTLSDNMTTGGFASVFQGGEFDMNGFNFTTNTLTINGSSARILTMNNGTLTVSGTGTVWDASGSNLTLNRGMSTIAVTNTTATAKTFIGGDRTYFNLSITGAGTGAVTLTGNNTFNKIIIGAPKTVYFTAGTTTVLEDTLAATGSSGNLVTINSDTGAASFTLSKTSGYVDCDWLYLDYATVTGGALWYAGANSTNHSNNSGWTFTAPPVFAGGVGRGEAYAESPQDPPPFDPFTMSGD